VLAQIALIVFAMFGVLTLIVDVGYLRLTQAQMQNAADAASLEGMRKRDVGVLNAVTGQFVDDPYASDCIRRASANRLVRWVFDDDLNPAGGDDYQFGAGPLVDVTDGATNLHALQTISVPDARVYKPQPQMNQQNQVHGDMVSGRFCYATDPAPSEGSAYEVQDIVCSDVQHGAGIYARNDFNPNPNAPQPPPGLTACPAPDDDAPSPWPLPGSGSLATVNDSAFLVRLRRSNEFLGSAGQIDENVASSGPAIPLLFGKATTVFGDDPTGGYSVRRDGLTVRATSIAQTRPAMHIGLPQTNPALPGVTRFAMADTFFSTAGNLVTINPTNGLICAGTATCVAGNTIGRFVANAANISTVGQALPAAALPGVACAAVNFSGYGPVYSLMASGVTRIIGFARIGLARDARPANATQCPATISRGVVLVAASNATASLFDGLPLPAGAAPAEVVELLNKNRVQNGAINYSPVLVPSLAR
jgi:hypothetical protein